MPSNVEVVRRSLVAFIRGEVDKALSDARHDVVACRAPPLPDAQTYHGRDGVLQMWADWTAPFSEFEMTIEDVAEVGERVVATVLQRGAGVGSGVEVEGRFWLVFTLVDGKIARLDAFNSERRALDPVKQLRPG